MRNRQLRGVSAVGIEAVQRPNQRGSLSDMNFVRFVALVSVSVLLAAVPFRRLTEAQAPRPTLKRRRD